MLTGTILLLLGMSIVASILILVLLASKLHIITKISTTAMVVITVIITYFSLTMLHGWPYKSDFPTGKYQLISYYPDERNKSLTIWLIKNEKELNWFTSLLTNTEKPRSIEVVYNKEMHEQLQQIMSMSNGMPTPVKLQEVKGKKEQKNWNTDDQETLQYVLPDVQIMEK
jgi:hypothetical protein